MVKFKNDELKFYYVDTNYLKQLNSLDSEVPYSYDYIKKKKPFIGLIVDLNDDFEYLIPLSSSRDKHGKPKNKILKLSLTGDYYYLVYEKVSEDENIDGHVYRNCDEEGKKYSILSLLDIKKMIPISSEFYTEVDMDNIDEDRKELMNKEYKFINSIKEEIIEKVDKLYKNKKIKNVKYSCNLKKLEEYIKSIY